MIDHKYFTELMGDLFKQKEAILLEQLNDLVTKGLLVIEETKPVLVQDSDTPKIILRQAVRLALKDKEYIQKLETENAELKAKLEAIKQTFKEVS